MNLLATADQVDTAIAQMAAHIISDTVGQQPLFVVLLRGGAPFASKLMFAISTLDPSFHPELDYMMVSTYGSGRHAGQPHIVTAISPKTIVQGRLIIILDDVLDTGNTAAFVMSYFREKGASDTKLAVLVEKDISRDTVPHADFACFHAGSEWLAGMGMDSAEIAVEADRWVDEIRVIT